LWYRPARIHGLAGRYDNYAGVDFTHFTLNLWIRLLGSPPPLGRTTNLTISHSYFPHLRTTIGTVFEGSSGNRGCKEGMALATQHRENLGQPLVCKKMRNGIRTDGRSWECTATQIPSIYSFSGNCAASVLISKFMCLWAVHKPESTTSRSN
jgi:hypothetical protein